MSVLDEIRPEWDALKEAVKEVVNENAKLREEAKRHSGVETCEADETDLIPFVRADSDGSDLDYIHVMECNSCGGTYEHVNGSYEFCPRCGRKVVDE